MDDIKIFSNDNFYILSIDRCVISHLDWNNPDYVQRLVSLPEVSTHNVTKDNLMNKIYELLELTANSHLMTETIWEEPNYIYQIIFIDTLNKKTELQKNELASLFNISGEVINGKAVIVKNFVSTTTNDMRLESMTSSDLYHILHCRGYTKICIFEDDEARESEVYGDIEVFAKKFFEDESYLKRELPFLKHNINILYTKSDYGTKLGNLIDTKIDKCIIYTMLTADIRGCITKDEVNKIIVLSTILEPPYLCDTDYEKDEKDDNNRQIVKNKYRILDYNYNINLDKN